MTVDLKRASARDLPVIHYNDGTTSITTAATSDALDRLITRLDMDNDPLLLEDYKTGAPLRLTPEEAALVERLMGGYQGDVDFDPFQPYVDFFTQDRMDKPVVARTEPRGRFTVSKWETQRIRKLVYSIRKGYIRKVSSDIPGHYDIWASVDEEAEARARKRVHVPAPKPSLPGHEESYNPPEEYLPIPEDLVAWEALPEEEKLKKPLAKRYKSLRLVPLYDRLIQERFSRCLDLYLCSRVVKDKVDIADPDSLLPELPAPDTLRPYPTVKSTEFIGHLGPVACLDIHASGQWLVSCSSKEVRVWDAVTGRCMQIIEQSATYVSWCPRADMAILAVASDKLLLLLSPDSCGLSDASQQLYMGSGSGSAASMLKWRQKGAVVTIEHDHPIDQLTWHHRGDYLACLSKCAPTLAASVIMHQLSRRTSQRPFARLPAGHPRSIQFSRGKPYFCLATSQHIRIYDLMSQRLVRKLGPGVPGLGAIACHPTSSDNLIAAVGEKICWFDTDFSAAPYKTLHTHTASINSITYSTSYPLFATAGEDGTVQIFHGRVYEELDKTALIVPVRVLGDLSGKQVKFVQFHPTRPWLYAADSTGTITLFV